MKDVIFYIILLCGALGLASCSGEDEEDTKTGEVAEEVLSEETTPITFELDNGWEHFLFDYTASGRFVGSDTFAIKKNDSKQATTDLRQGKHKLIWLKGLRNRYIYSESEITDPTVVALLNNQNTNTGLNFNPDNRTLILHDDGILHQNIFYFEKSLEVTQYLMTTQKLSYTPVTCMFEIEFTDASIWSSNNFSLSFPFVSEIGLTDNRYEIRSNPLFITLYVTDGYILGQGHEVIRPENVIFNHCISLCPLNGLDDIQLTCGMIDPNGQLVTTDAKGITVPFTPLPKISLRRGYTTKLTGPLLNGSISDWTVEMEPYK